MFQITQRHSSIGREVLGGLTTFMAMSYIIFVQPTFLGPAGMNPNGVVMATCIGSAIACVLMALLANYPIALAPGMGVNAFFAYTMVGVIAAWGIGIPWQVALALTVVAGLIFLALSTVGFRARLLNAIPDSLKSGIAGGIGLFIAVIGFEYANLVVPGGGLITSPPLQENVAAWTALIGIGVTLVLLALRVHGAILLGILASTGVALLWGQTEWITPVALPEGIGETAGAFWPGMRSLAEAMGSHWAQILSLLFVLLFIDMFDTIGTLVGVTKRAGLMVDGRLEKAPQALAADAAGTVAGGMLGTSTITSYIESVTGVQAGARTGLSSLVVAACLIAALFFQPLVQVVIGQFYVGEGEAAAQKFPTIAPALIVVGAMMLRTIRDIDWDEPTEYIPGALTVLYIPVSYSIADGIALGLVTYVVAKVCTGRAREVSWIVYIFAVLLSLRYFLPY